MSSDSAAKVFAIPELLENMLLSMPECKKTPEQYFGILRVSRGFKSTIEGSIKLQELMFLAPHKHTGHYESVAWLMKQLVRSDQIGWRAGLKDSRCHLSNILLNDWNSGFYETLGVMHQRLIYFQSQGIGDPQASWRKMRMGCSDQNKRVRVQFNVFTGGSFHAVDRVWWKFDSTEKLEALYEKWSDLLKIMAEFRAKRNELWKLHWREKRELEEGLKELRALYPEYQLQPGSVGERRQ